MAIVRAVHPVLSVRRVQASVRWYAQLGFRPLFADNDDEPTYAGIGRDRTEIHLQWHSEGEWAAGLQGAIYLIRAGAWAGPVLGRPGARSDRELAVS
jgi:hypothetical protein